MNKTRLFQMMGIAVLFTMPLLSLPAHAHDEDMKGMKGMKGMEKAEAEEVQAEIPTTVEGIWKEIHKEHAALDETVKSKKLDQVHHHAFAIRDLVRALVSKAAPDKTVVVKAANKKIFVLAEALDKAGDAGDQAATEANAKKLHKTLVDLEMHFDKN